MKHIRIWCLLLLPFAAHAQYYYKDLLSTGIVEQQFRLLKEQKIKKVVLQSFESDDRETDRFLCYQVVNTSHSTLMTHTQSAGTMPSVLTSQFSSEGTLQRTSDSSGTTVTVVLYGYANSKLTTLESVSRASSDSTQETDRHEWTYGSDGLPIRMLRIKNNVDTTEVLFKPDEQGRVAEETWKKKGVVLERYYYYYNDSRQLTDIVRYSKKARRLLPDNVFEYDTQGRVSRMIGVQPGSSNYVTWAYVYNENGLKQKEVLYNKQRQLMGTIRYRYE
jgi:hypothetical protein